MPGLEELMRSPHLQRLTALDLGDTDIDTAAVRHLAASPFLGRITELRFASDPIGAAGLRALATSPYASRLSSLGFSYGGVTEVGPILAASPFIRCLRSLSFEHFNTFDDAADIPFDDADLKALLDSPNASALTELNLDSSRLTLTGLRTLAAWPFLAQIKILYLDVSALSASEGVQVLGDEGVTILLESRYLGHPHQLGFSDWGMSDIGGRLLCASSRLERIKFMKLWGNQFSADVRQALKNRFGDRVMMNE